MLFDMCPLHGLRSSAFGASGAAREVRRHFMIGFPLSWWQRQCMLAERVCPGTESKRGMKVGGLARVLGGWCSSSWYRAKCLAVMLQALLPAGMSLQAWLRAVSLPALLAVTSCAPPQPFVWASRLGKPDDQQAVYRIGPGDEIYVLVADQQALSGTFVVGPDGGYIQPVVGNVAINGLTTKEAAQQLTARLAGILVRPQVTISVTKRRPIRVSVIGEVQKPGRFELPYDDGILAALASAGGFTEFADQDSVYVVRREPHLLRIRFRLKDLAGPEAISARFRLNDSDVIVVE
jgi:polysaccharide biosynthesis/export protein